MLGLMLSPPALLWAQKATAELWEGTVRQIYIDKPLIGARGYLVSNLEKGQARVEVSGFPQRDLGYEVFLFEIDVPPYVNLLFKDGNPNKGLNDPAPPFDQIGPNAGARIRHNGNHGSVPRPIPRNPHWGSPPLGCC